MAEAESPARRLPDLLNVIYFELDLMPDDVGCPSKYSGAVDDGERAIGQLDDTNDVQGEMTLTGTLFGARRGTQDRVLAADGIGPLEAPIMDIMSSCSLPIASDESADQPRSHCPA